MKSGKQRRTELKARRAIQRAAQFVARRAAAERAVQREAAAGGVAVDPAALAPNYSSSVPAFVERGYYVDLPFECRTCGEPQTWTAAQQKWWYEVAKGNVWTTARLCRPCRQRERARREEARRVSREGLEAKAAREQLTS